MTVLWSIIEKTNKQTRLALLWRSMLVGYFLHSAVAIELVKDLICICL